MKSGAIVACALALAGCASHAVATSLIGMTLAAALSGCANRPDSIHAEYISYERFAGLSCQELETRLADMWSRLTSRQCRGTRGLGRATSLRSRGERIF